MSNHVKMYLKHYIIKVFFCSIAQFLFLNFVFAQQQLFFDHLGIEKGLSQNSVLCITQDKSGIVWLGTRYGLNSYDGYHINTYLYRDGDTTSLSNDYITSLYTDSKGNVWVGTGAGLNIYNPTSNNFKRILTNKNALNNTINCITEDKAGNIWVGTTKGLKCFIKGNINSLKGYFNGKAQKSAHNVRCIYQDNLDKIWIGTSNGLFTLQQSAKDFTIKDTNYNLKDSYITAIVQDRQQKLWIATKHGGLNLLNNNSKNFIAFKHDETNKNSIVSNTIRSLIIDAEGKLWVGTLEGLSVMHTQTFKCINLQYDPENSKSLSQNSVYSLFKDASGSIWVGTYFGGINVNYPYNTAFTVFKKNKHTASINNNVISGFAEDTYKNLWIGTEGGGLTYFNRKNQSFTSYKNLPGNANSLTSNLIKKIFIDKTGLVWIGTHAGGLNVYNPKTKTFKSYNFNGKIDEMPDEIIAIIEDKNSCLWIATQRNGIKLSNPTKTAFNNLPIASVNNYIKNNIVKSLSVGSNQNIYIGTTKGLLIFNQQTQKTSELKKVNVPLNNYINCTYEAKNGTVYIGTYYTGLIIYNPKNSQTEVFTEKHGLPNNNILGILEDENGYLWIGTGNGLSRFNPSLKKFKTYSVADGLPGNEFNQNAAFKSTNGEMFFGGYNGFISFFPDKIQTNTKAGEVIFTDLKLNNKVVNIKDESKLLKQNIRFTDHVSFKYNQNTFTIDFALLNFIKPEKNKYAYKLSGFEKDWNEVTAPSASYTNLPPGDYTFLVKGINNDGYSSAIKSLKLHINPPFYRTWWAYLFYFALLSGVLFVFIRYLLIRAVLKKEKEINIHKLEFFTNISHEIRTPLTLILGPLNNLIENPQTSPLISKNLLPIKKNTDRLMNLVTELLDFRKAESGKMTLRVSPGNLVQFCKEIFLAFQNIATNKGINYGFETNNENIEIYFDKLQLEKVLFNLLSNAIKFANTNGKITFYLTDDENYAKIKISNTGTGIPLAEQANLFTNFFQANSSSNIGTGLGLSLSKSIVELHKGNIYFESNHQTDHIMGYTCFSVDLKKGKTHFEKNQLISDYTYYDNVYNYKQLTEKPTQNDLITPATTTETNSDSKRYTLLLAEDNEEVRNFIKSTLEDTYQVYEAADGIEGYKIAETLIPDLILSDVMMPNMDGLAFCKKLKTDERTSHIPVILLTARSTYIHQINGLETGADAYIHKPFDLKILQLTIHNLLTAKENIRKKFAKTITLEPKNLIINDTEHAFLDKVISIIEKYISDSEFDVPTLAAEIGMSQPVLYKKIRALTDLSVNDFIKSLRLKNAALQLKTNKTGIAEIAYSVGFNDRKYFSLAFKKQFGKTPSEYMEAHHS